MKLFDYDSGLMRFMVLLSRLTILNLVWLICCIPVFTIGASTAAQHYAAQELIRGDMHVFQNFKTGFKLHWKGASVIWAIFLALSVFLYLDYEVLTQTELPGENVLRIISYIAFAVLLCIMLWVYPIMVNFSGKVTDILYTAFVLAFIYLPITLIAAAFYGIAAYLFLHFIFVSGLILLFGPTLITYMILVLFEKVFQRYKDKDSEA